MSDRAPSYPGVDPAKAGAAGHCPRCGKGPLFQGFLKLRSACGRCKLDFRPLDQADGPAFFVMTVVGFVVVGLALYVEVAYSPSIVVHLLLWIPLTIILSLPLMRIAKGLMVGLQYRNKAAEGRWAGSDESP
ncbi:DUF983 domain-containing protein [Aureimonas jatrophae]|uniref:Uncharacterized conserved protein, DUF983 family n=1 Tax=Aureimonas jatrophae TaxID=1166073 RepID=A0A1H0GNU7_9HYPH|nr:DUF983 domain-containing protein [Aureimonas jatrophae]SDO08528.1 Uncharacterized conserved protein, DUF983 family [Aureimonas jatrophae]